MAEHKTLSDLKKFLLNDYPEYGKAFYDHFEQRREELIAVPWVTDNPRMEAKCQMNAAIYPRRNPK